MIAINKPSNMSSAQVLRNLQGHFDPSRMFAPYIINKRIAESQSKKRRRPKGPTNVKIGHGGTLDPLATGVLVAGIGRGTKELGGFLECTKTYETVVLFGVSTDTYDCLGKVVKRKSCDMVTEATVTSALETFKGKIMQVPPIYSALRVQGKHMYEYAREGKELPIEIKARPVEVLELELLEWLPAGTHEHRWPEDELKSEEKAVVESVHKAAASKSSAPTRAVGTNDDNQLRKRKIAKDSPEDIVQPPAATRRRRNSSSEPSVDGDSKQIETDQRGAEDTMRKPSAADDERSIPPEAAATKHIALPSDEIEVSKPAVLENRPIGQPSTTESLSPDSAPAARIRMTVTSGFYVRSLCHDLGKAVGSLGLMSTLVRTRQGQFELGKNVLEYDDLGRGEEVWGPQVQKMLEAWVSKTPQE